MLMVNIIWRNVRLENAELEPKIYFIDNITFISLYAVFKYQKLVSVTNQDCVTIIMNAVHLHTS